METALFEIAASLLLVAVAVMVSYALYWTAAYIRGRTTEVNMSAVLQTALDIVRATEQLWVSGQLEKSQRAQYAIAELKRVFPKLDEKTVRRVIESAVHTLREIDRQLTV